MKLTDEMKDALHIVGSGGAVVHLTTCSADGKPNTVGERFIAVWNDEYILIADMFAQKQGEPHGESYRRYYNSSPC